METVPGPEVSDSDIDLLWYVRLRPEPFATATDIEPRTSVGRKQTRNRLDQLVEKGWLKSELVGTTKVYWITDEGKQALADADTDS